MGRAKFIINLSLILPDFKKFEIFGTPYLFCTIQDSLHKNKFAFQPSIFTSTEDPFMSLPEQFNLDPVNTSTHVYAES